MMYSEDTEDGMTRLIHVNGCPNHFYDAAEVHLHKHEDLHMFVPLWPKLEPKPAMLSPAPADCSTVPTECTTTCLPYAYCITGIPDANCANAPQLCADMCSTYASCMGAGGPEASPGPGRKLEHDDGPMPTSLQEHDGPIGVLFNGAALLSQYGGPTMGSVSGYTTTATFAEQSPDRKFDRCGCHNQDDMYGCQAPPASGQTRSCASTC